MLLDNLAAYGQSEPQTKRFASSWAFRLRRHPGARVLDADFNSIAVFDCARTDADDASVAKHVCRVVNQIQQDLLETIRIGADAG